MDEESGGLGRGGSAGSESIPAASSSVPGRAKKRSKKKKDPGAEPKGEKVRRRRRKKVETEKDRMIKYGSLLLLVAQMVGLVLLMRYTRTRKDGEMYLASSAVFVMEIMKLIICCGVIFIQQGSDPSRFISELRLHTIGSPEDMLKLCVPSLLYTVQNNLLYLALTNLDAATYQVLYQLKILTTALFSATLLQRKFSPLKWSSLVLLTVGVAIVQTSGSGDAHHVAEGEETSAKMVESRFAHSWCGHCADIRQWRRASCGRGRRDVGKDEECGFDRGRLRCVHFRLLWSIF
uniref:UDP-N-acetylglucosamine transporter n=1 Tax=Odontella aurita TaxID=265563 RepID=A0A7S4JN87_9STRA|mmetsp:Transcript_50167/g.151012  ORF Transcript_50167/g.151012 Transcript_50167/m.151012 type:complete len:291 (+) Transcript_50167:170-1042(+)